VVAQNEEIERPTQSHRQSIVGLGFIAAGEAEGSIRSEAEVSGVAGVDRPARMDVGVAPVEAPREVFSCVGE
jgi:hypothetical protein